MNKKLLSAAISAAMVTPAAMAGDVTIYGVAHVAMSYYDLEHDGSIPAHGDKVWDLASHASHIGFKGFEDLGGGLSAIWQMEIQMELADGGTTGAGVLDNQDWGSMRNSFVGLSGNWGTFLVGRHDTPYKLSTASLDLFADTIADYNSDGSDGEPNHGQVPPFWGLGFEEVRADSAVAYISPNLNGLTLAGAFMTAGGPDHGGLFGYTTDLSDLTEAYSVAALYNNGPFFASLAYEAVDDDTAHLLTNLSIMMGSGDFVATDKWRVGLGYTADGFHVGFVYEDADYRLVSDDVGIKRWQLSGSYTFGDNVLKAMYGSEDTSSMTADMDQWAVGLDHNFSKRTQAYVVYTDHRSIRDHWEWDGYSVGLKHTF